MSEQGHEFVDDVGKQCFLFSQYDHHKLHVTGAYADILVLNDVNDYDTLIINVILQYSWKQLVNESCPLSDL